MPHQFLRGDTASNDGYTGPEGSITVDLEADRLRVHDGVEQGGYTFENSSDLDARDTANRDLSNATGTSGSADFNAAVLEVAPDKTISPEVDLDRNNLTWAVDGLDNGLFPDGSLPVDQRSQFTIQLGVNTKVTGLNRCTIASVGGPVYPLNYDRVDIFGNQSGQFGKYAQRTQMIGSNVLQFVGDDNPSQLYEGWASHPYWRDYWDNAGPQPGEVGWDYNGMATRNSGLGAKIAAYTGFATNADLTGHTVAVGRDAAGTNIRSDYDVWVGYRAGGGFATEGNVGVGLNALNQAAFAVDNVAVGRDAGRYFQEGSNVTMIGRSAGQDLVGISGGSTVNNATLLGAYAGRGLENATGCVLIGYRAGEYNAITSRTDQLVIGTNATQNRRPLVSGNFVAGTFGINADPNSLSQVFRINANDGSLRMFVNNGMQMAGASGGDLGLGTINATAVYDDNTLLTCYPIEAARTGTIDVESWDKVSANGTHTPARRFLEERMHLLDVDNFIADWQETGHLATLPSREEWKEHAKDKLATGELVQRLWETVDIMAVHIAQLRKEQK